MREALTGGQLRKVSKVIAPDVTQFPKIRMACDVTNPLCGPDGAAAVYGPQKGATAEQVRLLDSALKHLARLLNADTATPGFGAAGGAALTPVMLLGATMERGIELVFHILNFEDRCRHVDLVITGEGSLDAQSLNGKATVSVAKMAAKWGVPTIAIVGRAGEGVERCVGPGLLGSYLSLVDRFGEAASLGDTAACITAAAQEVVKRC